MGQISFSLEDVRAIRETDAALLCTGGDLGDDEVWVPKSQIHDDSEVFEEGHEGGLAVKAWYGRKKGWC